MLKIALADNLSKAICVLFFTVSKRAAVELAIH